MAIILVIPSKLMLFLNILMVPLFKMATYPMKLMTPQAVLFLSTLALLMPMAKIVLPILLIQVLLRGLIPSMLSGIKIMGNSMILLRLFSMLTILHRISPIQILQLMGLISLFLLIFGSMELHLEQFLM